MERDLGVPVVIYNTVDNKLSMSEHGLLRQRNPVENSIPSTRASQQRERSHYPTLFSAAQATPGVM